MVCQTRPLSAKSKQTMRIRLEHHTRSFVVQLSRNRGVVQSLADEAQNRCISFMQVIPHIDESHKRTTSSSHFDARKVSKVCVAAPNCQHIQSNLTAPPLLPSIRRVRMSSRRTTENLFPATGLRLR